MTNTDKATFPPLYKGAFVAYEQPVNNNRLAVNNNMTAEQYWIAELAGKDVRTIENYKRYFEDFLIYLNTDSDKLLQQRIEHLRSTDIKTQRTIESFFLQFLKDLKQRREYENGTLQVVFASIRSFFEMHYVPLRTRRKDYPRSTANGVRRATKEALIRVLTEYTPRNKEAFKALIMTFKDTGLRVSDLVMLNCDVILDNLDKDFIPITVRTEKTGLIAKTFLGADAINALEEYLEARRKGSRAVEAETITKNSPLIRTWENGTVKRMSREGASTIIREAFLAIGEKKMSAHSLRKKLQTDLEKAGINSNWIDQILGHELINSRDAYSLPTDEELQEAYEQAYPQIKITPDITPIQTTTATTQPQTKIPIQVTTTGTQENFDVAEAHNIQEVKTLLAKGYKFAMECDGIKLFTKKPTL